MYTYIMAEEQDENGLMYKKIVWLMSLVGYIDLRVGA